MPLHSTQIQVVASLSYKCGCNLCDPSLLIRLQPKTNFVLRGLLKKVLTEASLRVNRKTGMGSKTEFILG